MAKSRLVFPAAINLAGDIITIIEIQIDEAQTRLKELVNSLGPEDEVRLLDQTRVIARITPNEVWNHRTPQQSVNQFRIWADAFIACYEPVTTAVDVSRESIY